MSKMKQSFETYLKSNYSKKGEGFTHTRIGDKELNISAGCYTINNIDDFYAKYIKHVFHDGKFEFLTEKQNRDIGPIMLDFDFRYSTDIDEKQHTEENITDVVNLYFQEISDILQIPCNTDIPVFVFEKENVNMLDNITKDGIHMIIGIHMDRTLQILLRNRIIKKISDIWSDLPLQNTWDEVFDEGVTQGTVNWQLYGSRKPGNENYLLKQHYELNLNDSNEWSLTINNVKQFDLNSNFKLLTAQYDKHQSFEMDDSIIAEYEASKQKKKSKTKIKIINKNNVNDITEVTNLSLIHI